MLGYVKAVLQAAGTPRATAVYRRNRRASIVADQASKQPQVAHQFDHLAAQTSNASHQLNYNANVLAGHDHKKG